MYLGVDLGTSGVKALLIDGDQAIIGSTNAGLSITRPHTGWSEQDPDDWISAAKDAIESLRAQFPMEFGGIRAIGLSGQMHGAVILDQAGKPLTPAILWNDTRCAAQAAVLDDDPQFRATTGNIVFPGFTAPKLVWLRDNDPAMFEQVAKVVLPKDYLRLWLTGEYVSDMSDASGTGWLDVGARGWSSDLLAATQMDVGQMPDLVEGSAASGMLTPALSSAWGLGRDVIVAGGAGDNAAASIGLGCVTAGSAFVSLGTSGVLFAPTDKFMPNPASAVHAFCHAVPDTWHQMGVILAAADALSWWSNITNMPVSDLIAELDQNGAPSDVQFLPYLSGERTPHNDANLRASFHSMAMTNTRADLTGAVLTGVAFALRDNLAALAQAGTELSQIMAVGGGTKSSAWLQILANVLNCPITLPQDGEFGAAFGAARLGLLAATGADVGDVALAPSVARVFEPEAGLVGRYVQQYGVFKRLGAR
jgi:xylulokinase